MPVSRLRKKRKSNSGSLLKKSGKHRSQDVAAMTKKERQRLLKRKKNGKSIKSRW